ncbi:hypothetical protein N7456_013034 [Penicillium angulare]|uniref:Uncharacterized protein n=1 Tax=Penicillium angulare TaxID=116970 RepID=A0A9W9EKP6_9EURO|nr:hypothetical protein N7456_013034 [Penicillium angulare]
MRPAVLLLALAPVVIAGQQARALDSSSDLALRAQAASIPDLTAREQLLPLADSEDSNISQLGTRHVLQARSEGSLGQTPWIGMAIGLTCTALAAAMLG